MSTHHDPPGGTLCQVPGCGRTRYGRQDHCQTHHRQMLETGTVRPIRPYRPRSSGTVKFAGLRLSPEVVREIERICARKRISQGAAIALALEAWHAARQKAKPGPLADE